MDSMSENELKNLKKSIGQKIKSERIKKNMRVEELALILNVSESFIRLIERGERGTSIQLLLQICNVFDLNIGDFFSKKVLTLNERKENAERQNLLNVINNLLRIMDMTQLNFILEMLKNLEVMRKNMAQIQINKKNYVTGTKERVYGSRNKKNKLPSE